MTYGKSNYNMGKEKKKLNNFYIGDLVYFFTQDESGSNISHFGIIYYRYCEEVKMESFLKKNKNVEYDNNSKELRQFFINEIKEIGSENSWKLDDRYIKLVFYAKTAKA